MRSISTSGIIIRKQNRGEHDCFITLYSPTLGKIQAVAKGARKIDSSFSGHLETLNICSFQLHKSPHSFTVTQCQTVQTFRTLRDNFEKSLLALLILEIFQRSTYSPEQARELFDLLDSTLHYLSKSEKHQIIIESFKIKLLQMLGVMPDISRCSHCQRRWNHAEKILLGEADSHFSCLDCAKPNQENSSIDFNIIKLINFLCLKGLTDIIKISLSPQEEIKLKQISHKFLQHYIDREIVSEKIIAHLKG